MPWLVIVLRLLHIGGGVLWAGSIVAFAAFVEPTATALGPKGVPFVQHLGGKSGFTQAMVGAALVTVLAGLALLWIDSGGFQPDWMAGGMGVTISVGALCGIVAAIVGIGVGARDASRLGALAEQAQQTPGGPTPEQLSAMHALQRKLRLGGRVGAALLVVAVVCMAVARYAAF